MNRFPLMPNRFRFFSIFLFIPGLACFYLYYLGGKPAVFTTPVFAFITAYAETRWFTFAQTNLLDEAAAVFLLAGLAMLAFSKEKTETGETAERRLKAMLYAAYFSMAVWLLSFLFIFGWVIFIFSTFIFPLFLVSFLLIFRFMQYRQKSNLI